LIETSRPILAAGTTFSKVLPIRFIRALSAATAIFATALLAARADAFATDNIAE
jgi:hypothetical protein